MVDEPHSYSSPAGSGTPDPAAAEQKPPAIRTMRDDLSNAKSGSVVKPPEAVTPIGTPTPIQPQKDASVVSNTKPVRIPEPPSPPKSAPPRPPAIPKPTEMPKQESVAPPTPKPPQAPHIPKTPPDRMPVHPAPTPKPPEQKPIVPAITASLKPIASEHVDKDTDNDKVAPEGPALAEDELLSTEEAAFESTEEILDVTQESEYKENINPRKKLSKKTLVFTLIGVVLFAILGGGGYFAYSQGLLSFLEKNDSPSAPTPTSPAPTEAEEEPTPEPIPRPEPIEEPLLSYDSAVTYVVSNISDATLEIDKLYRLDADISIVAVTFIDELGGVVPLDDLALELGIVFPPNVLELLDLHSYTVFLTNESSIEKTRIGIVIRTTDPSALSNSMLAWESSMVKDIRSFVYRFDEAIESPANEQFATNLRQGIPIRYVKFTDPTIGVAYAVIEDYSFLVIGTSRQNILEALDAL